MRASMISERLKRLYKKSSKFFSTLRKKSASISADKKKLNRLIRSSVALALMMVLLVTMTFSWLATNFTSSITNDGYITIDADAGLQMNYGEDKNSDGSISINKALGEDFALHECSSTDGRNIFFPTYEYSSAGDKSFVDNVNTADLLFREATANDKNTKYISVDFTLSAKEKTDVWLSSTSNIKCNSSTKAANAIRLAFVDKSVGGKNTVFCNATDENYTQYYKTDAVKAISTLGVSSTESVTPNAFIEYEFGNAKGTDGEDLVLFRIDAGKTINASMIIWLEGTDKNCTNEVFDVKDLEVYIKFTTSRESMRPITFIDRTLERWVDGHNDNLETIVYVIDTKTNKHYEMDTVKGSYVWTKDIPASITDVRFARYNPQMSDDVPEEWNYWEAGTLGSCETYYAVGHSAGLWTNTFTPQTITIFDGTNDGWIRDPNNPKAEYKNAEFKIKYTVTDGNGEEKQMYYKMSYQHELHRYSIVIPKNVTKLSFYRVNQNMVEFKDHEWTNLDRGTNYFFNITGVGKGYWSTRYIYIYDQNNNKKEAGFGAYFYDGSEENKNQWTGMHSKSPSGYYVAVVPMDKQSGVVFTRYNTDNDPSWNNVYNQTDKNIVSGIENFGRNNLFTFTGFTGEKEGKQNYYMNGSWSKTNE